MGLNKGKRNKDTHVKCRRCGKKAYHARKSVCAACGFGKTAKRDDFNTAKPRKD
ncbi:50S ribosomal protein L37e [Nanohaloarchaea archaeon]|jgi:large subunit ribosomal protein L37e|nr:MAG: LSU ribosomal protein L37E [Candidatus Nanosalinarum sp. J07AB56]NMJ76529.1 50S ribosomal protein L37e [Candidatus Nanohaloarchaea archaeon]